MAETTTVKVVAVVKFRSRLPPEEAKRRYRERMPEFRQLPGLVQKYYCYDDSTAEWAGIYLWDSHESAEEYLASDLRRSIPAAYEIDGAPRVETLSVMDTLRS